MLEGLSEQFNWAWDKVGAKGDSKKALDKIVEHYQIPGEGLKRVYHTEQHAEQTVLNIVPILEELRYPAEAVLALTGHDAIYDSQAQDNERKSADLMTAILTDARVKKLAINRVAYRIICTDHLHAKRATYNADIQTVLDSDLAILGAPLEVFAWFDDAIRTEYAWVSDEKYSLGRTNALQTLKGERANYFRTPYFRNLYEEQAVKNVEWALERLRIQQ